MIIMQTPPQPPAPQMVYLPFVANKPLMVCSSNLCDYIFKEIGAKNHFVINDEGIYNEMATQNFITIDGVKYEKTATYSSWTHPEDVDLFDGQIMIHTFVDEKYFITEWQER